jgi:CHAT domain-containing protein
MADHARDMIVGRARTKLPNLESPGTTRLVELLTTMDPTYVGFVSPHGGVPIELLGNPPLSTRFAIGRLAGPDLMATSILVARAALSENVVRPASISALFAAVDNVDGHPPLPGAKGEVQAVIDLLASERDFTPRAVSEADDLKEFVEALHGAHLVHFAGHRQYDPDRPGGSGLIFRGGLFTPDTLSIVLAEAPLVFGNACESATIRQAARVERAWSGLAADFIRLGASNYLGSLWPIFDSSSQRLAECFYRGLLDGLTVGEALRNGRRAIRSDTDLTWAAFVLFGCPRNRLRARRSQHAEEH